MHQAVPDQDRIDAGRTQSSNLFRMFDSALRDHRLAGWDLGEKVEGLIDVNFKSSQISVIDANYVGVNLESALELLLGPHLDDAIKIQSPCLFMQFSELTGTL